MPRHSKIRFGRAATSALAGMALLTLSGAAVAGPLNDTGIEVCLNHATPTATRSLTTVTPSVTCSPMPTHGAQDARYGRDAAAVKGQLTKVGASAGAVSGQPNGFDFTKISNSGARLPADAALGAGPDDWGCTFDNNTGLLWEVKTSDGGLRDRKFKYTWFNSQRTATTGGPGVPSSSADATVDCATAGRCDTEKFVQDVNSLPGGMCGKTDWRMPTFLELLNLMDLGRQRAAIDPSYFPNTGDGLGTGGSNYLYWTGTSATRGTSGGVAPGAPAVNFFGSPPVFWHYQTPSAAYLVRLVRRGL